MGLLRGNRVAAGGVGPERVRDRPLEGHGSAALTRHLEGSPAERRPRRLGRVEADLFNPASYQEIGLGLRSIAYNISPGSTFTRDANEANAFSKLSRYETALERSLYRALHELQRLQAARRAEGSVSPPVAVDVEVSGISREDLENGFVS